MPQSRRHEDGPKQGPGDDNQDRDTAKVWEGLPGPAPAAPSLTSAYSALLALILPQTNAPRPRDDTTALHQSTEPVPQAGCGPAPKLGPARGQAPPSSITAQWKPLLLPGGGRASDWSQSCVADGGHACVGRKCLMTAVWLTCW